MLSACLTSTTSQSTGRQVTIGMLATTSTVTAIHAKTHVKYRMLPTLFLKPSVCLEANIHGRRFQQHPTPGATVVHASHRLARRFAPGTSARFHMVGSHCRWAVSRLSLTAQAPVPQDPDPSLAACHLLAPTSACRRVLKTQTGLAILLCRKAEFVRLGFQIHSKGSDDSLPRPPD